MICYQSDAPDCCHLIKTAPMFCISPKRNLCDIDPTHPVECPFYEPGDEKLLTVGLMNAVIRECFEGGFANLDKMLKDYDSWRNRCIRGGVLAGILVWMIAYAAWVVWMTT